MNKIGILISKAPEDPEEKKEWIKHMSRIQFAMWVDEGVECDHCRYKYKDVDDMLSHNTREGYRNKGDGMVFVCDKCWPDYELKNKGGIKICSSEQY